MKSIEVVVLFFLMNTIINCQPIDINTDMSSKVDHRLMFNHTDSSDTEVIDDFDARISNGSKNSERILLPQDVELVESPRKNQQQSVGMSGVGSLIDIIFAVNYSNLSWKDFQDILCI